MAIKGVAHDDFPQPYVTGGGLIPNCEAVAIAFEFSRGKYLCNRVLIPYVGIGDKAEGREK